MCVLFQSESYEVDLVTPAPLDMAPRHMFTGRRRASVAAVVETWGAEKPFGYLSGLMMEDTYPVSPTFTPFQ